MTETGLQTRGFDSIPKKERKFPNYHIGKMYVCDVVDMDSCGSEASCAMYQKVQYVTHQWGIHESPCPCFFFPCGKEKAFMDIFSGQRWYTVTVNMLCIYYVCAVLNTCQSSKQKKVEVLAIPDNHSKNVNCVVCTVHTGTLWVLMRWHCSKTQISVGCVRPSANQKWFFCA